MVELDNKAEETFKHIVKNLYSYFKRVDKIRNKNRHLKNELLHIRKELVEVREFLEEVKKKDDTKKD